ncbi:ABC transporter transmembrane domain-containing protein [Ideonella livida]|uniref:ABC transporter transmembrane domain-containing protein n=1 Tax=Ideonella livida TaxID=2707176 RepID=UPI001EF23329|nr:ABC transporter transmembrane domain-containing protein [Ideonella livida]
MTPASDAVARRFLSYIAPQKWGLLLGVACFMAAAAMEPLVPALLSRLLDDGFKADMGFSVWWVPPILIGMFAARGLLLFCGAYLFAWSNTRVVLQLREEMVAAVMRADAALYGRVAPGVLASQVITDPQNAVNNISGAVVTLLRDGTTLLALLGYLFYLNWKLTLISLITLPLLGLVVRFVKRRVMSASRRTHDSHMRLIGITDDIARAWRVVRTFDAVGFESRRFSQEAQQMRRMAIKSAAAGASMTPLTQTVASLGVATILTMALVQAQQGSATVGEFVGFITALLMTISPMRHLTDVTQPIANGLIGAGRCFELLDTPKEPDRGTRELDPAHCQGEIRFAGVGLTYPDSERPALQGLDLHVPAGTTVALVGASGAGKTTIVSTLLGFAEPTQGEVTLDGVPLSALRKANLRRQFAVVSQDIVLFDGSIADNVTYALPFDAARVESCLRAANLWDFVQSQPEGLRASIGTNGNRLSGGQRQRLAIARALYKDARIWIFDEATSALDTESERIVQQSIEQWQGRKTLILIAHRLSTVRNADCIHVLADGRVVEAGRHAELMARQGLYAGMVGAQALG